MTRRGWIGAAVIVPYYLATVFGHLEVSLWLVRQRESDLLGSYRLADFLPHAGALLLIAITVWQARRARCGCNHARTLTAWTAWCAAVALADRLLIYSFPEYLHYPQYALLAWMMARLHDPDRTAFAAGPILLAVSVLGIADEVLQYTWLTISYSHYLDFNDFLLNLLGAVAGLLLYYGFAPGMPVTKTSTRHGLLGFAWLGTFVLLTVAALQAVSTDPQLLQPMERQPSYNTWIPGPHAGHYYVLDPVTGTLLLTTLGALASAAPIMRRRNKQS